MRFLTINVNHRTRAKPIPGEFMQAIADTEADVVILTEYVDHSYRENTRQLLADRGYANVAVSPSAMYTPGRWHNQVLVASRMAIADPTSPAGGPGASSQTNTLIGRVSGVRFTATRTPAYKSIADWTSHWRWLGDIAEGELLLGDLNADPVRSNKRDRQLDELVQSGGWSLLDCAGEGSYFGIDGRVSRIDHALVRGSLSAAGAEYIKDPFVPGFTDHAALVVDVQ